MPYKDPERRKEYNKQYYAENKAEILENGKEYYDKNKVKKIRYQKEYYIENRVEVLEYKREYNAKYRVERKVRIQEHDKQRIIFLDKQLRLNFRQSTGYCSKCPNNVFDGTCKQTNMHHYFYVPCIPWACRQELCASCHSKITMNKRWNND